jgi:uncharacterized membrane protein
MIKTPLSWGVFYCYASAMKNMDRLVNFSDAVMAIAVTLLVLPLVDRAADAHVTSWSSFSSQFGHLLLIFVLSFVVICRYWEVHHDLLGSLKTFDTKIFWLNAAWLLSIALVPFTSELIGGKGSDSSFVIGAYIGSLLIMSYIGILMQFVAVRSPELRRSTTPAPDNTYNGISSALAMTLAFILAVLIPSVGPAFLLLLIPAGYAEKFFKSK